MWKAICLINTIAKVYEILIEDKLIREIEERGNLANSQYGFRKGRSTVKAIEKVLEFSRKHMSKLCIMLTLEVKNALNLHPGLGY